MATFLRCCCRAWVLTTVAVIAAAAPAPEHEEEQIRDRDHGTGTSPTGSPHIVRWICFASISSLAIVSGCACIAVALRAYRKGQAKPVPSSGKQAMAHKPRALKVKSLLPQPQDSEAALADGKEQCSSEPMGAVVLSGDTSTCCRDIVELLYQASDEEAFASEEIKEVRDAQGHIIPFVVEVPEAHLTMLERTFASQQSQGDWKLEFIAASKVEKSPAPATPSSVTSGNGSSQKGLASVFKDGNDNKV